MRINVATSEIFYRNQQPCEGLENLKFSLCSCHQLGQGRRGLSCPEVLGCAYRSRSLTWRWKCSHKWTKTLSTACCRAVNDFFPSMRVRVVLTSSLFAETSLWYQQVDHLRTFRRGLLSATFFYELIVSEANTNLDWKLGLKRNGHRKYGDFPWKKLIVYLFCSAET